MTSTIVANLEQLLEMAQAGDDAALGQLLEHYRHYLTLLARWQIGQRLQGKVDASDIVQETYLGACRDFEQFRGATEKEFTGWLRNILGHVLANTVRHYVGTQQRDVRMERRLAAELEKSSAGLNRAFIASHSSPSQNVARREMGVLMAEALARLPDDKRELLVLRHFEGLSFPEAAQRMSRTVDSVKKLWPHALAHLRRSVKEQWHECENDLSF